MTEAPDEGPRREEAPEAPATDDPTDDGTDDDPPEPATTGRTPGGEGRRRRKRRHEQFRVPAWVILFVGPLVGWAVADVLGAVLGLAVSVVAWRSRV